jgi:transposase
MMIIGCDFHPSWQQIAWLDSETGETGERKLVHAAGDAKAFYQQLAAPALIGVEATGNSQWFIEMGQDLGMRSGSGMRHRSEPVTCASRKRTNGMRPTF